MSIDCPVCGESFEDGRGLHGHLRFKEGLSGDELERTFEEAKSKEARKEIRNEPGSPTEYDDPRMQAVENLRRAKDRLQKAKDRKEAFHESSGGHTELTGFAASDWQQVKKETRLKIEAEIEECQEEVEKYTSRLDEEIRREVERRG
jgi:hypothetical protein